jgi:aspartate/methionine/tyrosine aminotransferase
MAFFQRALAEKVITVPGQFFDINPGNRRQGRASRFERHVRFSFGPRQEVLEQAVERLSAIAAAPAYAAPHGVHSGRP